MERVVAGRYRLLALLGRGGMGAVWRAYDTLLGRDVAIKEIWSPGEETAPPSPAVVRRALREAQAVARLRHPGIVTVHDVVTEADRPWIVMELIDGRSLAGAIEDHGFLPERRVAEIGRQVLLALQAAHRGGVVHRDVKPANILLDGDRVMLTDFGIAAVDDATALTATGQLVGSPGYLSPERINGKPVTAAADLWALGVTLYTAATGRSPFRRDDTPSTLAAVLASRPDPPAHAGRLWPVIKGLLVKDPAGRLGTEQALRLLEAVAAPPVQRREPRWWRRRPRPTMASGATSAVADTPPTAVAPPPTLAATTEHRPAARSAAPADDAAPTRSETFPAGPTETDGPTETARPTGSAGLGERVGPAETGAPAESAGPGEPVGPGEPGAPVAGVRVRRRWRRRVSVGVALVVLAVSGTVAAVWPGVLKPLLGATPSTGSSPSVPATAATRPSVAASAVATDPFVLASGIAETWDLAVSRNGKVLVTHDRQSVRFFDLVGRRSLGGPLATSVGDIWSVALSPDGTLLAVGGKDGRLQLLDVAGRKPSGRTLTGPDPVSALDFSPDGRRLAAGHWEGEVTLWDVPARRSLGTLSNGRGGWLNTVEFSPDGRTIAAAGIAGATLWDVASRQRTHLAHDDPAYTAVFSPDGRTVATGTTRARVHLWDVRTGKRTAALDGKTDSSTDFVAFSPDGGWLVAKPLRIWNLGTRSVVARESWAGFVPSQARFTPDGRYLIAVRLEYGDVTLFDASWMG